MITDTLDKLMPQMQVGAIITFQGVGEIANIINQDTGQKESHIGQVTYVGNQWCFAESSVGEPPDIIDGKIHKGISITPLRERIGYEQGKAWLHFPAWPLYQSEIDSIAGFWHDNDGIAYDFGEILGLGLWYPLNKWFPWLHIAPPADVYGYICSLAVIAACKNTRLLQGSTRFQSPGDVAKWQTWQEEIPLMEEWHVQKSYTLGGRDDRCY